MTLTSMTGFARAAGAHGPWRWTVELKMRQRQGARSAPAHSPGFDRIEAEARARLAQSAGARHLFRDDFRPARGRGSQARVDAAALASIAAAAREAAKGAGLAPPTMDGVLAVRGVVEIVEAERRRGDDRRRLRRRAVEPRRRDRGARRRAARRGRGAGDDSRASGSTPSPR